MEKIKTHAFNFVIADDDPDDQHSLQRTIWDHNQHHKITSVYNGMQLLEYLMRTGTYKNCKEPMPDCIFLDINMPLLNGKDVLKKLGTLKQLSDLPVYILSGNECPQEKEALMALGAKNCYIKSATDAELKNLFNEVLYHLYSHSLIRNVL